MSTHAGVRPEVAAVRAGILAAMLLSWWLLSSRNAGLRAGQAEALARAQVSRELRLLRVAELEAQAFLPDPGQARSEWWRERLVRETARLGLAVTRIEGKPTALSIGVLKLERRELVVTGPHDAVMKLVYWIETSVPRIRLEQFAMEGRAPGVVLLSLTLLVPVQKAAQ